MSSFAIGVRDWTQPHSATSRNDRNMFGIVRKSWKFFFGNADKMHTKVSLLRLRKREQCSVVLFAFLETRREFYWRRNLTRDCFWDCYWGRTGQLLPIFFSVPSNNPGSLCESYWPIFPSLFLITIPEVFAKVNSTQFLTRF